MSSENLNLLEQQSLHVFAVLAIRAKREFIKRQISLIQWSLLYLIMASLCLKIFLGSSVIMLVLAILFMIACLYNESESLWAIQEQLIEIVRSTPVESVNSLIDQ
jgi:hypothetical protein